jgi:hypothetical protein
MAAARSYKRGEYKGEASDEIKQIADSMTDEELTDYMTKEARQRKCSSWLMKEASVGRLVTKALATTTKKKPITYSGTKRYLSRRPELADILPEGAKKIKTDKAGDLMSYVDPTSGYKHTAKTPSLLETIGHTSLNAPRIFKNPKHDKLSKYLYRGSMGVLAGKTMHDVNEKRTQYDTNVQGEADKTRSKGHSVLADLMEQGKSGNVVSRLLGLNDYVIPEDHFLAPLNYILNNLNRSAVKEGATYAVHEAAGNKTPGAATDKAKMLFKPPVVSSGLPGRTARNILGEPKSGVEMGQTVLQESVTPEAAEKMVETPNGRIILNILEKAKSLPAKEAQGYVYDALNKAESLWKSLSKQGNRAIVDIESEIKDLL